jgi:lipoate-protein ligase A
LDTVAASGQPILRFYAWEQPTLSLGYFQNLEERESHAASLQCPVVRRSTGGGAILHDRELTYSVALPLQDRWSHTATTLYETFHGGLVAALAKLGLVATLCLETDQSCATQFLCFERRAKGDVIVGGHKIAGSAQRRRQGAMLQHGSVVLATSAAAPEIVGLSELQLVTSAKVLADAWTEEIRRARPKTQLVPANWETDEISYARALQNARFSQPNWLRRRTAP